MLVLPLLFGTNMALLFYPLTDLPGIALFLAPRIAVAAGAWCLLYLLLRDGIKVSSIIFLLSVVYYLYTPFSDFIDAHFLRLRYRFVVPVLLLLLPALILYLARRRKPAGRGTALLFYLPLMMLLVAMIQYGVKLFITKCSERVSLAGSREWSPVLDSIPGDIYLLLVDGLAGTESLRKHYSIDNHFLDSGLQARGFGIASGYQSNYSWTHFSLASLFNQQYLQVSHPGSLVYADYLAAAGVLKNNKLAKLLTQQGFDIYSFSRFPFGNHKPPMYLESEPTLEQTLYAATFDGRISSDIGWLFRRSGLVDTSDMHQQVERRIAYERWVRDGLYATIARRGEKRKFVLAHFFYTHDPFIYDSALQRRTALQIIADTSQRVMPGSYAQNLRYANMNILACVDSIRKYTHHKAVVIVMSDHGFRVNMLSPDIQSNYDAYCAVYLPDRRVPMPPSLNAVNLFHWLFSLYGAQSYDPLPAKTIFLKDKAL